MVVYKWLYSLYIRAGTYENCKEIAQPVPVVANFIETSYNNWTETDAMNYDNQALSGVTIVADYNQ